LIARLAVFGLGLGISTALRWARFFPNNDPIMAVTLPYAKRGRVAAAAFPALAMVLFDLLSRRVGIWTLVTAGTYGLIGLGFSYLYSKRAARGQAVGRGTFFLSGIVGVLLFDFVTGPVMSSALFHMSFAQAFVGQVPFTLKHLVSVSLYAAVVSPLLDWALGRVERAEGAIRSRFAAEASRSA
jgi:uncharacterized membrane protein